MKNKPTNEKALEIFCISLARKDGWVVFPKFETKAGTGAPDRHMIKNGRTVYVEFKFNGGVLSPQQEHFKNLIMNAGMEWYLIDEVEKFKEVIK